jgi:hypothetical protein
MSHPLTDQLPDYLDALALRQACGEIEAGLREEVERLREVLWEIAQGKPRDMYEMMRTAHDALETK